MSITSMAYDSIDPSSDKMFAILMCCMHYRDLAIDQIRSLNMKTQN